MLQQYQHIFDEKLLETLSSEDIIEHITRYYEDIIGCMPGNVFWINKNGLTLGCNHNVLTMLGLKKLSQFKGLTFEEMGTIGNWTPEATQSFKQDTLEVIKTGKAKLHIEEPPIPHAGGSMIYFLTSRVPLFNKKGDVIGVVGISTDITAQKKAQEDLKLAKQHAEIASRTKSEFVANMSHDLKTPLAGIIGVAELLVSRLKEEENLEFAHALLRSGRQLLTFIDNCLETFRHQTSDIASLNEYFNFRLLMAEIADLFQPTIKTKSLLFILEYDEKIPPNLYGNRENLYRILLNLLGNAVKFTHKGHIKLSATLSDNCTEHYAHIKIIIEDTGIGIPKHHHEKIFDHFTRLIPSYKGIYEGSGMGLYIVKQYVEAMNGSIHVSSEEGVGSQFITSFTFQTSPVPTEVPFQFELSPEIQTFPQKNHSSLKVLLVEDNIIAQKMQHALISSLNCDVEIASSGEEALHLFFPGKYDLIFMDIGLPGMQGDAVSAKMRALEKNTSHHVTIIALTAHGAEEFYEKFYFADIQDAYNKPLLREQAKKIIEKYSRYSTQPLLDDLQKSIDPAHS